MVENTKKNTVTEIETDENEELLEESNAALIGRAGGNLLGAIAGVIKEGIYKVAAFAGGLAKSFLFGDPNPQKDFWESLMSFVKTKTYPCISTNEDNEERRERNNNKLYNKEQSSYISSEKESLQNNNAPPYNIKLEKEPQDISVETDNAPTKDDTSDIKKSLTQRLDQTLIPMGFGGFIVDDKLNIASIDEQGNVDSNIYVVELGDGNTVGQNIDIQSLSAAIFQIEHENMTEAIDASDSYSFDNDVMSSNIKAAVISLDVMGKESVKSIMQTTMGPMPFSVHKADSQETYQLNIDGKEYLLPMSEDVIKEIPNIIKQFRDNPPQHTFTIEERKGKEIQVDWERGNPEFFAKVVIDGETKYESAYVATEAPQVNGEKGTKTLANFVSDLGNGHCSKVPEWSSHDLPIDKKSTWISSSSAAYTIAGIVNPSGISSVNKDEPDKFFSLIHAGKSDYIDANTAHIAIDFAKGKPQFVANHGISGYIYTNVNVQDPTETAKQIEQLKRVIKKMDPSEEYPILSPQDGKRPSKYILESIHSKSNEVISPVMISMIGGQICTAASMYIGQHQSIKPIEKSTSKTVEDILESVSIAEEINSTDLSNEEYTKKAEEILANTFIVEGADEISAEETITEPSNNLPSYDECNFEL